ncbi:MAG: MFS transporter [Oscillospiraceae bacterium]
MFFGNAILSNTTSLFMAPICAAFGFDSASYSVITMIGALVSALAAAVLAPKMQKGNMKVIFAVCTVIAGLGFAAMGLCTKLWQFYLVFGICNFGFGGIGTLPVSMMLTSWFNDKRAVAMGIAFCAPALGTAVWAMIFADIIASGPSGWITCYYLGGGLIVITGLIVAFLFVKKDPASYGQEAYTDPVKKSEDSSKPAKPKDDWLGVDKGVAFKSSAFFMLAIVMFIVGCLAAGVATHSTNYLVKIGWDIKAAGNVLAVFSLVGIVGQLGGGVLFEKVGALGGTIVASVCGVIGLLGLIFATNPIGGYVFAVAFALSAVMPFMLPALLTSMVFGVKDYPSIYSIVNLFMLLGCAIGAVLTGVIDGMAGYAAAWWMYIVFCGLLIIFTTIAMKNGKKLREKYPNPVEKA